MGSEQTVLVTGATGKQGGATVRALARLQMIAVSDIGLYAARVFTDAANLNRREIDLAGDEMTMPDAAAALSKRLGSPISVAEIPISEARKNSADFAMMLEWFERVGYNVDIPALTREFGISPTTLDAWASAQRV